MPGTIFTSCLRWVARRAVTRADLAGRVTDRQPRAATPPTALTRQPMRHRARGRRVAPPTAGSGSSSARATRPQTPIGFKKSATGRIMQRRADPAEPCREIYHRDIIDRRSPLNAGRARVLASVSGRCFGRRQGAGGGTGSSFRALLSHGYCFSPDENK